MFSSPVFFVQVIVCLLKNEEDVLPLQVIGQFRNKYVKTKHVIKNSLERGREELVHTQRVQYLVYLPHHRYSCGDIFGGVTVHLQ